MINPVVIIGAGLSGLWAAALLNKSGIPCRVLEARNRIGGRVLSTSVHNQPELGRFDLGPTWFWPVYENTITKLVQQLNLKTFGQHTTGAMLIERSLNDTPERYMLPAHANLNSIRFAGGVQSLIDAVACTISPGAIELETRVTAIRLDPSGAIQVEADLADGAREQITASSVILAFPPRNAARHLEFAPPFPQDLMTDLTSKPTWMAGQAKAVVIYDRPFWREIGLSGFVSSRVGPLQEIHDASPEKGAGALFGFFGLTAQMRQKLGQAEIEQLVKNQLIRLFGPSAKEVSAFLYKDWSQDAYTAVDLDCVPLMNIPVYGRPSAAGVWEKKLFFAGTETDAQFGGHLEGALRSAESAVAEVTRWLGGRGQ